MEGCGRTERKREKEGNTDGERRRKTEEGEGREKGASRKQT